MRKIWCTLLMLGSFAATVNAAPLDAPPPYAGDSETVRETLPPPKVVLEKKSPEEGMSLAPSEEDIRKAREDREKGVVPKVPEKRTKIEAVRDQDNRVTEYVVTPGSTQIPYTMENRAERPIDTSPGGNSQAPSVRRSSCSSVGNSEYPSLPAAGIPAAFSVFPLIIFRHGPSRLPRSRLVP